MGNPQWDPNFETTIQSGTQVTDNVREDRVAPRTAAGKKLLAKAATKHYGDEDGTLIEAQWQWVYVWELMPAILAIEAEAEAAPHNSDELRKAVERVAELEDGIRAWRDAEQAWIAAGLNTGLGASADIRAAELRALLSAGDKALPDDLAEAERLLGSIDAPYVWVGDKAEAPRPKAGRWVYNGHCEVTPEDHEQGEACQPLLPHSHRPESTIKWARWVKAEAPR